MKHFANPPLDDLLESFIFDILGKRNRRLLILTRWLTKEINLQKLFECILYQPVKLQITNDRVRILDCDFLDIEHGWLTQEERKMLETLFVHRYTLFGDVQFFKTEGTFMLRQCKINTNKLWPIEQRREILRDFVWLLISKKDIQIYPESLLLGICQKLIATRKKPDRFIEEMHNALQGRGNINEVLCVYP